MHNHLLFLTMRTSRSRILCNSVRTSFISHPSVSVKVTCCCRKRGLLLLPSRPFRFELLLCAPLLVFSGHHGGSLRQKYSSYGGSVKISFDSVLFHFIFLLFRARWLPENKIARVSFRVFVIVQSFFICVSYSFANVTREGFGGKYVFRPTSYNHGNKYISYHWVAVVFRVFACYHCCKSIEMVSYVQVPIFWIFPHRLSS